MSKLLFEENPKNNVRYMNLTKRLIIMLTTVSCIFALLLIANAVIASVEMAEKDITFDWIYILILVLAYLLCFVFGLIDIKAKSKVSLRIYEDKICYKNAYQQEYKEINLSPDQYRIQLGYPTPRSGYTVKLVFLDMQNKHLFTYKAVSLCPSLYNETKNQWEIDLFSIGCDIIDDVEVIKNK